MKLVGRGPGLLNAGGGTIELTDLGISIDKKNVNLSGGGLSMLANATLGASKSGYTIPYSEISHINISKGGWVAPPFIQILTAGDRPVSDHEVATKSPTCLLFKKDMLGQFEKFKVEAERRAHEAKKSASSGITAALSPADEIKKLSQLRDDGIISASEFEAKKRQLLGL